MMLAIGVHSSCAAVARKSLFMRSSSTSRSVAEVDHHRGGVRPARAEALVQRAALRVDEVDAEPSRQSSGASAGMSSEFVAGERREELRGVGELGEALAELAG